MNNKDDYACSNCGDIHTREELSSKKVLFGSVGYKSSVFRTRTVAWLCERCLGRDPDYNFPRDMSKTERMEIASARRKERELEKKNKDQDRRSSPDVGEDSL